VVKAAAMSGRLHVLQHLLSEHPASTSETSVKQEISHYAAYSGSISMLNWLRTQSWCLFDYYACEGAAEGGQLAAMQHLRNTGCEWDVETFTWSAARSGNIELVEWLRQQPGIVFDCFDLSGAVMNGHGAMCEHLLSIGCRWDTDICSDLIANGNLEALRLVRALGCPWHLRGVVTYAARYGYTGILDFVIEQEEVLDAELMTSALNLAGVYGKLQAAQWSRQHGAQWPVVLSHNDHWQGLKQWSGESLAWARAEGCTSPTAL
jgi:hypothetical protein